LNPPDFTAEEVPEIPVRIVLKGMPGNEAGLCCPVCGSEYVHPLAVIVEQGHTRTEVKAHGTTVTATDRFCRARGSLVELGFACEQGHDFRYALEFHKGSIFLQLAAQPRDPQLPLDELWRN